MANTNSDIYRILDAALNRTREGLRVIEDFVRFGLNDAHLSTILKELRHELTSIVKQLSAHDLLTSRDTLADVGTSISTATEYQRESAMDVVSASFKRVQEAVRTLEEYSKVVDVSVAPQFEQLRYRLYTAEKAVFKTEANCRRLQDQQVYLLVQAEQCQQGFEIVVKSALTAGVRLFQLREKLLGDRELLQQARLLRRWTSEFEAMLIINDRPDIAVLSDADGVHVGQDEFTIQDARRIVGPDRLVGVSTHSLEQARRAVVEGADYLGVGPTFPSGTKSFKQFPGLDLIREVAVEIGLPWFAIGGIDLSNLHEVVESGATRIAVSGAICRSPDPGLASRNLLTTIARTGDNRDNTP